MARKKFGISPSVNKALTQTIQMAEAEKSNFTNTEILIERIQLDPENPRKHKITLQDIQQGISPKDVDAKEKQIEYDGLLQLSASIQKEGLFHPIIVIEEANNFKLVAGERRYFATVLAKKKLIDARVFKKKPKSLDLKVIQWSENQSRKDLSLHKKLMNVQSIVEAFESENANSLTAIKLSEVLAVSRQQAQFYKAVLSNPVLLSFIKAGKVSTMEVARQLSNANQNEINMFLENREVAKKTVNVSSKNKSKRTERKKTKIDLGATSKSMVVKKITEAMLTQPKIKKYADDFKATDWSCFDDSSKAFQKLIKILEKELGATLS